MTISGECFCGQVTYQIEGTLRNGRSCHCSRCRKAFSGQASAYAEIPTGALTWLSGEDLLATYKSNEGFALQFCSQCGSTVCGIYQGAGHGVTLGCVDGAPRLR